MPIYEYECDKCGERFEKFQHFGESPVSVCPQGHTEVHRVLTAPTVIFNAPGFYTTDNRAAKDSKAEGASAGRTGAKCAACS
jgi:putative FmdB family regulatory protein